MKRILNYFSTIALVFVITFALAACAANKQKAHEENEISEHHHQDESKITHLNQGQVKALDLKLGTITNREMANVLHVTGQSEVYPEDRAEISSYIGANVKKINVYEGDKVKKGQVLAILEHPDFITLQSEYVTVFNQYQYLEKEYERQRQLFENKVGSQKNFQMVTANYSTARSQYRALKLRLKMLGANTDLIEKGDIARSMAVVAPIDGYVSAININLGCFVDAGKQLFVVNNLDHLHVDLTVYEKDVAKVKIGQKVRLQSEMADEELVGSVFAIGKEYEPNSKSIIVHVNLETKPKTLIIGHFMKGVILLDKATVPAVPQSAIVNEDGRDYIFIVKGIDENDGDAVYEMKEVILGQEENGWQEVTLVNKLPLDTQVVYQGAYYLLSDMVKSEVNHCD